MVWPPEPPLESQLRLLEPAGRENHRRGPVSPWETIAELRTLADEVISLNVPSQFEAVGQWYEDFSQTTDDEVTSLLARSSNTDQH